MDTYTKADGKVTTRNALDTKTIKAYELLNDRYEKVRYSDPTVLTIGGTEEFMLVLLKGELNLYTYYRLDGIQYVIEKGKKAQVIYNYSKLADFMDDKPEIAEKVKSGHYTDKPIKETSSKLERFVQQGTHNEISIEAVTNMVSDYNSV